MSTVIDVPVLPPIREVIANFLKQGINVESAIHDDAICDRIADPGVVVPVLTIFQHALLRQDVTTKELAIPPRLFLSAFLCLGQNFLDKDDPTEAQLYTTALNLLQVFEKLCRLLPEAHDIAESCIEVQEALGEFVTHWRTFVPQFQVWKRKDAERLISHYIATYIQVDKARRAMLLEDVNAEVPSFLREVRRQLVMVGGQSALRELNTQLADLQVARSPSPSTSCQSQTLENGINNPTSPTSPVSTGAMPYPAPPAELQEASSSAIPPSPQTIPTAAQPTGTVFSRLDGTNTPPRVVDLSKKQVDILKEAYAKAKLGYEAVCDLGAPSRPESSDPVRSIAEQAFWDVLKAEVSMEPPQYARVGALVAEVSSTLQECLPRDKNFREEIEACLDWTVLEKTLSPDLLHNFARFVLSKVMELEAPVHVPETEAALKTICLELEGPFHPDLIVKVFQTVMSKLRELRKEVETARRNIAKLHLYPEAVALQQQYVSTSLALGRLNFTTTRAWLAHTISRHFPSRPSSLLRRQGYTAVVREGLLGLLQCPHPVNIYTVPESLALDVPNLVYLQNRLQHVVLLACLLNIVNMFAAQKRWSLGQQQLQELKSMLDTCLTKAGTTLPEITDAVHGYLDKCATVSSSTTPLTAQDLDLISAMLKKTADVADPVFVAFRGKIVTALSQLCADPPSPNSVSQLFSSTTLQIVEADVRTLARQISKVLTNNVAVFGPHYYRLLNEEFMALDIPHERVATNLERRLSGITMSNVQPAADNHPSDDVDEL